MKESVYVCDFCGLMTTDFFLLRPVPLLTLFHGSYEDDDGELVECDYHEAIFYTLCPECLDRFTLFDKRVDYEDSDCPEILRMRSGRTLGGYSE